ncbi:MAG: hypothetical protein H6668_07680 [Ardenticatenaceae bacterium]|nr:hypothetical protein [Ardenticatenaceae bacterium]
MSVQVTLTLSDKLFEKAEQFGAATQRETAVVLSDMLDMMWPSLGKLPEAEYVPVTLLSDSDVLSLADSKMDPVQNARLHALQSKGKEADLTFAERYELAGLLQIYQLGQLQKSEAMAEVVRRGLRLPLAS